MYLRISLLLLLTAAQAGAFDQLSDWQKRVLVYAAPGVGSLETAFDREIGLRQYGDIIIIESWAVPGIPEPSEADLPSLEDAQQFLTEYDAALRLERQQAKPQAQKTYENAFFDLIDELLVLVDDPQDPTPKLGFPELQALIAQVQSVDPMAAVNLSLNLLTIDAALKRYDMLWWDNAVRHEITPE